MRTWCVCSFSETPNPRTTQLNLPRIPVAGAKLLTAPRRLFRRLEGPATSRLAFSRGIRALFYSTLLNRYKHARMQYGAVSDYYNIRSVFSMLKIWLYVHNERVEFECHLDGEIPQKTRYKITRYFTMALFYLNSV